MRPVLPAAPAAVTAPVQKTETRKPRVDDLFALDGFEFVDMEAVRPNRIPEDVWSQVFPPDRDLVRQYAGRLFLERVAPEDAAHLAMERIEREAWRRPELAKRVEALAPLFASEAGLDDDGVPLPPLAAAVLAVGSTARNHWRQILEQGLDARTVFPLRHWHAPSGRCLLCGEEAVDRYVTSGGDRIHVDCQKARMRGIGTAFGELVLAEAERISADPPPDDRYVADPSVDPDDPATYLDGDAPAEEDAASSGATDAGSRTVSERS